MSRQREQRDLLNSSAIADGSWVDSGEYVAGFSVVLTGFAAGDIAQVRVSDDFVRPADNTHGVQYGADVTADSVREVLSTFRWFKVRKSAAGGVPATTVAKLYAHKE